MLNYSQFLLDLKKLISFKTVYCPNQDGMPFGSECDKALNFFLDVAKDMGFSTVNYDGYAGEVSFGCGEEIGIIGHLDVVPCGNGWNTPPFELTVKDGKLFGRGVVDDKLPTLLCLYALSDLKNQGVKFNRKIRLFVGLNEETGWRDLEYLKTKTDMPKFGFSPDGDFPLSYAEKGIYYLVFKLPKFKHFSELSGGNAVNAVCDYAKVKPKKRVDESLLSKYNLSYNGDFIESHGVSAHGSCPRKGKNALAPIFKLMRDLGEDLGSFPENAFMDALGLFEIENEQGGVTISPNLIKYENGDCYLYCDMRVPAPICVDDLRPLLDKFGLPYSLTEKHPPVMVEKDGWFVNALKSAYEKYFDDNSSPIAMGGSTFARAFEYGCAFGMFKSGACGGCHEPNEHVSENFLLKAYNVYFNAIYNLIR